LRQIIFTNLDNIANKLPPQGVPKYFSQSEEELLLKPLKEFVEYKSFSFVAWEDCTKSTYSIAVLPSMLPKFGKTPITKTI
jgi:hypothetical protein